MRVLNPKISLVIAVVISLLILITVDVIRGGKKLHTQYEDSYLLSGVSAVTEVVNQTINHIIMEINNVVLVAHPVDEYSYSETGNRIDDKLDSWYAKNKVIHYLHSYLVLDSNQKIMYKSIDTQNIEQSAVDSLPVEQGHKENNIRVIHTRQLRTLYDGYSMVLMVPVVVHGNRYVIVIVAQDTQYFSQFIETILQFPKLEFVVISKIGNVIKDFRGVFKDSIIEQSSQEILKLSWPRSKSLYVAEPKNGLVNFNSNTKMYALRVHSAQVAIVGLMKKQGGILGSGLEVSNYFLIFICALVASVIVLVLLIYRRYQYFINTSNKIFAQHEYFVVYAREGMVSIDLLGYATFVNNAISEMSGYKKEELLSAKLVDLLFDGEAKEIKNEYSKVLEGIPVHIKEASLQSYSGEVIPVEVRIYPLMEQNTVIGAMLSFNDISERVNSFLALKSSEARLRDAQMISQLGSWESYPELDLLIWSDQMFEIIACDKREMKPSFDLYFDMIEESDLPLVRKTISELKNSAIKRTLEYCITVPGVGKKYIREQLISFHKPNEPLKIMGTLQDITEMNKVKLELEEYKNSLEEIIEKRTKLLNEKINLIEKVEYQLKLKQKEMELILHASPDTIVYVDDVILPKNC